MLAPQKELAELKSIMKREWRQGYDSSMVEEAFWISWKYHDGQIRASGDPYFIHPFEVAKSLAQKGMCEKIVAAALLHDTLEDTRLGAAELKLAMGGEVYEMVEGLTKLDVAAFKSRQEQSAANTIKTIIASSKDIRVLVIKCYDKLHNLKTLKYLAPEKRRRIAADALSVYVPLAHMLGIHELKREMEDLCFAALEPDKYRQTVSQIARNEPHKAAQIKKMISEMKRTFPQAHAQYAIEKKSVYTIYSKEISQNKKISELADLAILQVVVKTAPECYALLAMVHSLYKPIPKKIKDFIALPENHIYRGLHTQVIGPEKKPAKVYIYSQEMLDVAENGILSYLRDQKKNAKEISDYTKAFSRLSKPFLGENSGGNEITIESYTTTVFMQNGQTMNLPLESTALDFAFFSDEKTASYASKAEINGKIAPLWTKLQTGDSVRIYRSKAVQAAPAWKSFVGTAKAKNAVQKLLEKDGGQSTQSKLVKISVECLDRPGVTARQLAFLSGEGLDMEIVRVLCKSDKTTCHTEFYFRNTGKENPEKAIRKIKEMPETLDISVDYY